MSLHNPETPATMHSLIDRVDDVCDEETAITEMTFLPDGRICLFGASRELLELLESINLGDPGLSARLTAMRGPTSSP